MKVWSLGVALALALSIASGCGPAPGYGADGRRLVGPGYDRGGYGQPPPNGYVGPQRAQPNNVPPGYGPQQYTPQPGYQPYGQPAPGQQAASPPATTGGSQTQGNGVYMAPPYQSGQGAQPIAPDPNASTPPATPPTPPPAAACANTCRFANNGECDDGRANSDTDMCEAGTDCGDCGPG